MPDYDLGTAHGKIKVESDTRNLSKAERALKALQSVFLGMSRRSKKLQDDLSGVEAEIGQAARKMRAAEREARRFEKALDDIDKTNSRFSRSSRITGNDVLDLTRKMKGLHGAATAVVTPLIQVARVFERYRSIQGGFLDSYAVVRFGKALRQVGTASIISKLTASFLGMNKAMAGIPAGQQKLLRLAATVGTLTFTIGVLGRFVNYNNLANKAVEKLGNAFRIFGTRGNKAANSLDNVVNKFKALSREGPRIKRIFDGIPSGISSSIIGMALLTTAIRNLTQRFAFLNRMPMRFKVALVAAFSVIPAGIQATGKALSVISNILLGLLDGIKQLSGGFLALPGAIAMAVTAFGTLKLIASGIKESFKDLLTETDPEKIAEALAKLPASLKPFGKALVDTAPKLKEFRDNLTGVFLQGADKQLRLLVEHLLPLMEKRTTQVAIGWRNAKDQLVSFVAQAKSGQDINRIFTTTAQTMLTLNKAIKPALGGFLDIAVVGSQFLRELSSLVPPLVSKFAEWAKINRENGNIMRWLQDAWKGVQDLLGGFVDLTKAVWTVLTLFATDTGENFLARFAKAMEKFNDTVKKSAAGGLLKQIGDAAKNVGTDKIKQLGEVLKILWDTLRDMMPFIQDFTEAFQGTFIVALKTVSVLIRSIAEFLGESQLGHALGIVLALVAGWKLLALVIGPIRNIIQVVVGAFMLFKGAGKLVQGAVDILYYFGPAGRFASNAITKVGQAFSALAGPIGIAIAAGALFADFMIADIHKVEGALDNLENAWKRQKETLQEVTSSLMSEGGKPGKGTLDSVGRSIGAMFDEIDAQIATGPGAGTQLADFFNNIFTRAQAEGKAGSSAYINYLQRMSDSNKAAKKGFEELGMTTQQLAQVLTGPRDKFDELIRSMQSAGENGKQAALDLQSLRGSLDNVKGAMEDMGPSGIAVANGIDMIAKAGGNATTKLQGLKLALEGLGFNQRDAMDAAASYTTAIDQLATSVDTLADTSKELGTGLFTASGALDLSKTNAVNLYNAVTPLADSFLNVAASGGNIQEAYSRLQPQIQALAKEFGVSNQQVTNLLSSIGAVPEIVSVLVQLDTKPALADIATFYYVLQQQLQKGPIPVGFSIQVSNAEQLEKDIEKQIGDVLQVNKDTNTVFISPEIDQAKLSQVLKILSDAGVTGLPGQPPTPPAKIPVQTVPAGPPSAPAKPAPAPATPGAIPPTVVAIQPKVDQAGVDAIKSKVEELKGTINTQFGEVQALLDTTTEKFNKFKEDVNAKLDEIPPAFEGMLKKLTETTKSKGKELHDSGVQMMMDLASGIRQGIVSPGGVDEASRQAAQAIADNLTHHSPPKRGPLSGVNWVGFSGRKLAKDFAAGITSGTGQATAAGEALAGGVGMGLGKVEKAGQFLGELTRIFDFVDNLLSIMSDISNNIFTTLKFISDPLGKGTFFGQTQFKRTVSREEVQKKREDDLQDKISSAFESNLKENFKDAFKDGTNRRSLLGGAETVAGGTNFTKDQLAAAIVGEGSKRGYDKDVILGALSAALLESGINAGVVNATGHKGLFQMDTAKPGRDTAEGQINWFFDQLDSLGGPKGITNPLFTIADKIEKGGYGASALAEFVPQAKILFDAINSSTDTAAEIDKRAQRRSEKDAKTKAEKLVGATPPDENMLRKWVAQNFGIPNTFGTGSWENAVHPKDQGFHPRGLAFDFHGTKQQMAQLGNWIADNFAKETLELIYQGPGFDTGKLIGGPYGAGTLAGHADHVHWAMTVAPYLAMPVVDGLYTRLGQPNDPLPVYNPDEKRHGLTGGRGPGIDTSDFTPEQLRMIENNTGYSNQTQDQMLDSLRLANSQLDESIRIGQDPNSTDKQIESALTVIQHEIERTSANDTPAGRAQTSALQGIQSSIMSSSGFAAGGQTVIDTISTITTSAITIAQDIIGVIKSAIESVGGVKNIADTLVRGVANTEDIFNMVDEIQKFIDLAAHVAQAVGSISGAVASILGAAAAGDTSGGTSAAAAALGAVSTISSVISGALQTVNAVIDLAQEAYRIFGSYAGQLLGYLAGNTSMLQGNVKFLLDQNTGQLYTYSTDNPLDKRSHNAPGEFLKTPGAGQQQIGQINVYGGPGSDPRDNTRQMLYQVKAAQVQGVLAQ